MFVLLYSVCRSVSVLLCVDVIRIFTYVLRVVILDVIERRGVRLRERARGNTNGLSQITIMKNNNNKTGITGCSSFVVPYFQPATSIDRLHPRDPMAGEKWT